MTEFNTDIYIYRGIPFEANYNSTMYFENEQAQLTYFSNPQIRKYTLSNQSYQRSNKNTMRVEKSVADLFDCNYVAFRNTAYKDSLGRAKWFYAFITKVDYINDNTSEITYDIDVIQTYMFDFVVEPSFIEREHSETDYVGDNLIPEDLELGEYVSNYLGKTDISKRMSVVVACPYSYDRDTHEIYDAPSSYTASVYNGIHFEKFDIYNEETGDPVTGFVVSEMGALRDFITYLSEHHADEIVTIFYQPTDTATILTNVIDVEQELINSNDNSPYSGYTVKNNKLFTYPYNMLYVTNLQGNSATYPYEYFYREEGEWEKALFKLWGSYSPSSEVVIAPKFYKDVTDINYDEKLSLTGFPQCAYNVDTFKNYIANNGVSLAVSTLGSIGTSIIGATRGGIVGEISIASGIKGVANTVASLYDKAISPNQAKGSVANNAMMSLQELDFHFYNKHIRVEFAKIIDDYFNMFGYKSHRVKRPNLFIGKGRPNWNYIKTRNSNIIGDCPTDVLNKLMEIFDRGITFWNEAEVYGNYEADNSPVIETT